jgi:hypothetical protein
MFGTRMFIIRVISTVVVLFAIFMMGWYLFSRFNQLNQPGSPIIEEDINNPRLNDLLVEDLIDEYESKKIYKEGEGGSVNIPESDPFYN